MSISKSTDAQSKSAPRSGPWKNSSRFKATVLGSVLLHATALCLVLSPNKTPTPEELRTIPEAIEIVEFEAPSNPPQAEEEPQRQDSSNQGNADRRRIGTQTKGQKGRSRRTIRTPGFPSTGLPTPGRARSRKANQHATHKPGQKSQEGQSTQHILGGRKTRESQDAKTSERRQTRQAQPNHRSLLTMRNQKPSMIIRNPKIGVLGSRAALTDTIPDSLPKPKHSANQPTGVESPKKETSTLRIENYKFEKETQGHLTYRDPSKDFIAVIMPNGDLEFETRAPVQGGLCALGICTEIGGLRRRGDKKRKFLNRVRIRFAPVPLGLGLQFGPLQGVDSKKADLVRATFDFRLGLRVRHLTRIQKLALKHLKREMVRISSYEDPQKARRTFLARVIEIGVETFDSRQVPPKNRRLLRQLNQQTTQGAIRMCDAMLSFASTPPAEIPAGIFTAKDIAKISAHCESLRVATSR